jgi:hypothetical protein
MVFCGEIDKPTFEDNRKIFLRFEAPLVAFCIERKPLDVPELSEED